MNKRKNLILDLDGTLINSEIGVKKSLIKAFHKANKKLLISESEIFIGPPLTDMIKMCNKSLDHNEINEIKQYFKDSYDGDGCLQFDLYPKIDELLINIFRNDIKIFLGTNKRQLPTIKIKKYLNWEKYFEKIYCIDSYPLNKSEKQEMLLLLLTQERIQASKSLYIGDKYADYIAANKNNISFIGAGWDKTDFTKYDQNKFKIINSITNNSIDEIINTIVEL
ncbi:hypothetical protein CL656_04375 [bacterium]|nr:hypothetical protein [bacterium]